MAVRAVHIMLNFLPINAIQNSRKITYYARLFSNNYAYVLPHYAEVFKPKAMLKTTPIVIFMLVNILVSEFVRKENTF